jgi:adenosylcobalamin-dependent ribonucleoside-triphosphate reductase
MPDGILPAETLFVRELHPGMGRAVAERTVLRRKPDGSFETWGDVAERVAEGNAALCPIGTQHDRVSEKTKLRRHVAKATLLMSGRHLQHGDADQPSRNMEIYTNCATAAMSWLSFLLLLNGSGVGRCYDDDMMLVNWDHAPLLRVVISSSHPDFDWSADEDVRDAKHKYRGPNVHWHVVDDSREGWAKAVELWEVMAFQKIYADHTLVLDFSQVRPRGAPIKGMQGRPSSGPKPLMDALKKCATIKGAGMPPWMQALYIDHYLAECVLVGGARRSARMSTKTWRDPGAIQFARVKRPVEYDGLGMQEVIELRARFAAEKRTPPFAFLWSSNNSITVDAEFWAHVQAARKAIATGKPVAKKHQHAWDVLNALAESAYGDGTGEPGLINVDRLRQNDDGWHGLEDGGYVGSAKYAVEDDTRLTLARLARIAKRKKLHQITNPCGEISLSVLGGYCTIADVVPFHADTLDEAEDAFRVATRALMRVNLMDCLYRHEVQRTNRIGVGITGVHEFAWKFFQVGFRDLIDPDFAAYHARQASCIIRGVHPGARERAAAFWLTLARFSRAVQEEAREYARELGVNMPHTVTTIKPAGTTSKLFGLTEGWHLPAMAQYLRWVQFRHDDPLVANYQAAGYPVRELKSYSGTVIVGFPTQPVIGALDLGDALVTASEATPEEQYRWLKLGERYWIIGTDERGAPLHAEGEDLGNQISYTLKYDPAKVDYPHFLDMLIEHQSQIRCCSVLPVADTSAYEYTPEQAVTKVEYEELLRQVADATVQEEVDFAHVDCSTGACPVDFKERETAARDERHFVIYGYDDGSCRWCDAAKELILSRDWGLTFIDIKEEAAKTRFFANNPDLPRTVPQVYERFPEGNTALHIGGYHDLVIYLDGEETISDR